MTERPFAVFDIDGTLIRWQLYHAVVDRLARAGHIEGTAFQKAKDARMVWKNRSDADSFRNYERLLVATYNEAIIDISYDDFMAAVRSVFETYKDQTYTYTRDLIRKLKEQGYLLFAISASQQEIVKLLADYYGFDDAGGSIYEMKDGKFTGHCVPLKRDRKPAFLAELITKHTATRKGSIAVGDSDSDIPMLGAVEQPIAFNPNRELFQHAKEQGWDVILERKNMIYRLKESNGTYLLAPTDD